MDHMMNMTTKMMMMPSMAPGMHMGGTGMKRRMWMWFHTHINDTALFKGWWITSPGEMVWSCFVVMGLALILEALRWVRWVIQVRKIRQNSWWSHLATSTHLIDTVLYFLQTALSMSIMLFFMTFSIWLCFSLCIGLALGYYIFGTRRIKN